MLSAQDTRHLMRLASKSNRRLLIFGLPLVAALHLACGAMSLVASSRYAARGGLQFSEVFHRSWSSIRPEAQYSGSFVLAVGKVHTGVTQLLMGFGILALLPIALSSSRRSARLLANLEAKVA